MSNRVAHGGTCLAELRALGLQPDDVIDFSASVSPLGWPIGVQEALARLDLSAYPDPDYTDLRLRLAEREGVAPEQILVGNGSVEIIHLLARAALSPSSSAVIFTPAFGEYGAACCRQTSRVQEVRATEGGSFRWPLAAALDAVAIAHLVFLGNPNNPTGIYLSRHEVERLAAACGGLLVIDEAYRSFVDDPWASSDLITTGRIVLLRSLTKDYGLAGLRVGYAIGPSGLIAHLQADQVSWSVNAAAQAGALAALADPDHLDRVRAVVRDAKAYLCRALADLGLAIVAGTANFVMVKTGNATAIRWRLLGEGMIVRDCTSFGLPDFIRIGVRTRGECERLVAALSGIMEAAHVDG